MKADNRTREGLLAENEELRFRVEQVEKELHALDNAGVDAFMASGRLACSIIEQAGEAIIVCDERGHIIQTSRLAHQLCGENPLLKRFNELFPLKVVKTERVFSVMTPLQGTCLESVEVEFIRSDGQICHLLLNARPLTNDRNHIAGCVVTLTDFTERRQAEDSLRRAKEEWERTFASVPDLIMILDNQHRVLRINQSMSRSIGLESEECIGLPCYKVIHGTSLPPECCPHSRTIEDGCNHTEELHVERFGGDFQVTTTSLLDERGECVGSVHIAHDITERKRVEEALLQSESRLRAANEELQAIFNTVPIGLAISEDAQCFHIRGNPANERMLGVSPGGELSKKAPLPPSYRTMLNDLDLAVEELPLQRACRGEAVTGQTLDIVRSDGQEITLFCSAMPLLGEEGKPRGAVGAFMDITALKRAELDLKKAHDELEQRVSERTVELADTVEILLGEMSTRVTTENNLLRQNRLYTVLCDIDQAIIRAHNRDSLFNDFCRIAVEQGGFLLAWVGLVDEKSGLVRRVAASGATGYLDDIVVSAIEGQAAEGPTGISIRQGTYYICNDFQNASCTEPWHEKGRIHGIKSSASVAVMEEGRVIGALNLYAGEMDFFDRQHAELLVKMGADVSFALDNMAREACRQKAERALQEETLERLRAVEELREKEHLLMQQSRLAAMGEMINNIAHQWRQPLNALGLLIQQTQLFYDMNLFNKEFLDESVNKSMDLVNHMSQTIDDFRNFFKPDKEKVTFSVHGVVERTLSLVEDGFKSQLISIEVRFNADPKIIGFPNEFSQVLLNILMNARDALVEKRTKGAKVMVNVGEENERAVVIIADNAGGIAEEILGKIFDPYFTTKGPDRGTGVGLFMSKTIIEKNMNGRLTVRNTSDGAEFRIEV
ncbi:MAG: PAS domain-containing protein [Desulfuromonadales bacterium]|nr:PAS domain-containing protein [Desulfuromonadales bacterium]